MPEEKIPCPVDGCDEVFDNEADAAAHMKEKHRDEYAPPEVLPVGRDESPLPEEKTPVPEPLAMVPEGLLEVLDERVTKVVDARIEAALEAYLPQVQEAVAGAMKRVVEAQAAAAGIPIPGVGGGVVPGSPVTPAGAQLLSWITRQDQPSDMEALAKTLTQARAISDVLNPPSIWDRVMQNAVLRSLGKAGLVTDAEVKELLQPAAKP